MKPYILITYGMVLGFVLGNVVIQAFAQEIDVPIDEAITESAPEVSVPDVQTVFESVRERDEYKKSQLSDRDIANETLRQLQIVNNSLLRIEALLK